MTPDQARIKVGKLRAHAASVEGTPEAVLFYDKANELAREHDLPLTTQTKPGATKPNPGTDTPHPAAARPTSPHPTTPTSRRTTTMPNTTTKTAKPSRAATSGTLRQALNPRARAGFGRASQPGAEVAGYIVTMEEEPSLDYHTKAPKFDADGNEIMVPILIIQTDGTLKPYGQGLRKVWIRSGIADALIGACLDAGVTHPAVGGKVRIRYEGDGEPPAKNFAAPKLYSATYEPPVDQEAS